MKPSERKGRNPRVRPSNGGGRRTDHVRMGARVLVVALLVAPVLLLAVVSFAKTSDDLRRAALERREALSFLAAFNIKTKFDSLVTIGQAYADDAALLEAVETEDWATAAHLSDALRERIPDVNRIFITNRQGTLLADSPSLGATGRSESFRDWYQGVSGDWKPYVSNVYRYSAEPGANGIAIALPLRADAEEVVGIMVMQVSTETIQSWSRGIDLGKDAFVFFTDRQGQVAAHPLVVGNEGIVSVASIEPVSKAMSTRSGVEEVFDPILREKAVFGYSPVMGYGWTAVVEQPVSAAYAERDASIAVLFIAYAVIIALQCALAAMVLHLFNRVVSQRNREHLFLESIGDGVMVTDARGRVISLNKSAQELLGRREEDMLGRDFTDALSVTDARGRKIPRDKRPLMRALNGEKSSEKLLLQGADDRSFPASFTVTPVRDGRVVTGAVLVFRDISKEEELDRAKREFVSIASHQLLTPVSSAKGYLSMLLAGDLGDFTVEQKEYLSKLYQLNQRAVDLVDDLLNLSRVELGVLTSVVEPIDAVAFVRAELRTQESAVMAKRISIEERYQPGIPSVIIPSRLVRIIVQNLLSNAVKYTPERGQIRLELSFSEDDAPSLLLSVVDTGCGIPAKERELVFEKFYRAENARSSDIDGTGLGLYIVKSVVDSLKGKIWFESTTGKGTAFHVRIPVKIS